MKTIKVFGKSIPLLAIVAIIAVVSATTYITVTQYITQQITSPPDYGTITAPSFNLPNMAVGETITCNREVTVDLKVADKSFNMEVNPDDKYTQFEVSLQCTSKPEGSNVNMEIKLETSGSASIGLDLDVAGTYTFTETITATAGNTEGTATSTIIFTLEEGYPSPP